MSQVQSSIQSEHYTTVDYSIQEFHPDHLTRNTKQVGGLSVTPRVGGGNWELPYLAVIGAQPGPTLVVFAGVHGDEYEGMAAIPQIFSRTDPAELRGRLLMVPMCNIAAYEAATRESPVDGLNLARVYPGDPAGTLTQRIAYWTGQKFISQADFFIDLHSGNATSDIPTLIGYIHDDGSVGQQSLAAARAFGAPVLWGHPLPLPAGRTISLATALGIPALYTETPGAGRSPLATVEIYTQGVLNVMHHLGMLSGTATPLPITHHLLGDGNLDRIINAPAAGRFVPRVELLDAVAPGQTVGEIHDAYGRITATLQAEQAGVVILIRRLQRVHAGDGVIQITGTVADYLP